MYAYEPKTNYAYNPYLGRKDYYNTPPHKRVFWSRNLLKSEIKKPGYNWYKLGVSSPFDMNEPDRKFDIWLRLKFTGLSFPHGKKDEKDAIYFERFILVKH